VPIGFAAVYIAQISLGFTLDNRASQRQTLLAFDERRRFSGITPRILK
jgi:hypothetical protein